ncbi:MAG: tyrosine-type recombinase/integrase [Candidatus Sedimenticola sp. (ex Thyasira tokunagai)]
MIAAAGKLGRHDHHDKTLILVMYRHGLRVSELVALRWDQVDLDAGLIHINRRKTGTPSTHPLGGTEIRALHRLNRHLMNAAPSDTVRRWPLARRHGTT